MSASRSNSGRSAKRDAAGAERGLRGRAAGRGPEIEVRRQVGLPLAQDRAGEHQITRQQSLAQDLPAQRLEGLLARGPRRRARERTTWHCPAALRFAATRRE